MPVPNSVFERLKAILFIESLGINCVEARKFVGDGNLASLVKVAFAAGTFNGYEYIWAGRISSGLRPSAAVAGIVPSALIFIRVSRTRVDGVPDALLSVKPG